MEAKNIYFVGIGGIGCSSLAQILHHQGKKVSGSDSFESETTKSLKKIGIEISYEQKSDNINEKIELVIHSPAVPKDNPELKRAKKVKIPILSYPEALGKLTEKYYTIAIAGTHGKSTTTAITTLISTLGDLDPTVVIGTKLRELNNQNYRIGKSNYLIVEACEYKDSFLNFHPNILIITNIESDHLDYFKSFANYKKTFKKLCKQLPSDGSIIINKDDENSVEVSKNSSAQIISWSRKDKKHEYYFDGKNLKRQMADGETDNTIIAPGVIGEFNKENAVSAALAAGILNIEKEAIEKGISEFKGTWRRMEQKHTRFSDHTIFIDDYAHHPTAIKRTLTAIRDQHPHKKILCIFQPHQYSRTYHLLDQFSDAFTKADRVIIPNIYAVRDSEEDKKKISVKKLIKHVQEFNKEVEDGKGIDHTADLIEKYSSQYQIIVTMGAGDLHKIYEQLN